MRRGRRRLLAVAAIYDGSMRTEAAKFGDVTVRIVHDWVIKFNAHAADGLIDRKAPGQPRKLNDAHREALMKVIEEGPALAIHGVVRWRLIDLAQWIFEEFRFSFAVRFRDAISLRGRHRRPPRRSCRA
jgi:transposase